MPADGDNWREIVATLEAERDKWREESEKASVEARRLEIDRDTWRTQAQHWRAETDRLAAAERRRLSSRLRQARSRYARRVWRILPSGVQDRLRPRIYSDYIGPPPRQKDEAPPA